MSGYLKSIRTKIPHSSKYVDINLDGRSLILTGGNGCGKTSLLEFVYNKLKKRIVDKQGNESLETIENQIRSQESQLHKIGPANRNYNQLKSQIAHLKDLRNEVSEPPLIINDIETFVVGYENLSSVLIKFEAMRMSSIIKPNSVKSLDSLFKKDLQPKKLELSSSLFEEFLVSNKAKQAFSESKKIDYDPKEADRINKWFVKLDKDLKDLFEDDSLELKFKSDTLSFEIHQQFKEAYTFQTLSSGFSSIMAIYADLLTKVSLRSVEPEDLNGIVLIDEVDAHLHVSLQKKILSFLKQSFPKIQFIVSTHSPFVVSSISDAVIYDLSKQEQVDDLSMYSYESVLEGLFNVLPISKLLESKIKFLGELLKSSSLDIPKIQEILRQIPSNQDVLDNESAYFVKLAQLAVTKSKSKSF